MDEWKVENNYIVDANGAPILRIDQCCSYSSPIKPEVIAQIVRGHNSHDAYVKSLNIAMAYIYETMLAGRITREGRDKIIARVNAALEEVDNG